ncbi:hypothetical protein [Roseomonas elaeocarpi]|uniref:Uncharacterized protein n=1 Tax=Roseomonas elaeocarpi TaxID=907779 RepID=A0ABV6JV63_9PROT
MADFPVDLPAASRRVLDWLPPLGEWRELWFTHSTSAGPVPDEPILAELEAAVARGWAEGGEMVFGFNDNNQADGARTMRAYCTTPAGYRMKVVSALARGSEVSFSDEA